MDHTEKVLINQDYSAFKLKKKRWAYPGVFPNTQHPSGLYMPCCHKTDQRDDNIYKES